MSLITTFIDLFDSIFRRSAPEVQRKQLLKKMDVEIQGYQPLICKAGVLQPNFGEAIYTLYKNTRPLDNVFADTVSTADFPRRHRFEAQLIITGYNAEDQETISALQFQNRKEDVISEPNNPDRIYIHQRHLLERVIKDLNTDNFKKIDQDILILRQLVDLCHYNFVPFLQLFDTNFIPADFNYQPSYAPVDLSQAVNLLEDLYYQMSGLKLTNSTGAAVLALYRLRKGADLDENEKKQVLGCLKKINFIIRQVLQPEKLRQILRYFRADLNYEPAVASYSGSPRQEFAQMLQSKFNSDEQRIKSEIQDEMLSREIEQLFSKGGLEPMQGYNQDYSEKLQSETPLSFQWILPIRVLKTFEKQYVSESVKALLDDVAIEGFFNNSSYKSSFSQIVYAAINLDKEFADFENSFSPNERNSISALDGYIKDNRKDKTFYSRLEKMVHSINNEAHNLLQSHSNTLFALSKELEELLADAKKPSSEIIQNLKVLLLSSRNKERTNLLDYQFPNWKIFFEIMKNYVIINNGDLKNEQKS